jgi:hypothetical protein
VKKICTGEALCSITLVSTAPAGSIVSYAATAEDSQGNKTRKGDYIYGVGNAFPPWVPARLTERPHTQAIDLCFVMDTDYQGDFALFQSDAYDKIHNRLFETAGVKDNTEKYNFYLTRTPVNAGDCGVIPEFMELIGSQCDAFAVLHQSKFRDCTSGDNFSAEGLETKSFVREAGHAIYGLSDEYEGDTSYFMAPNFPNIFGNFISGSNAGQLTCQAQVASLNGNPGECNEFCDDPADCGAGWWRHTTDTTVMTQGFFDDRWGIPARARVDCLHGWY